MTAKRIFDFLFSLIALLILAPPMAIIMLLILICGGRPVLYRQTRPGLNGKLFTMYKFRTMVDKRDEHGELLPDDQRLTRFGSVLRSWSLDELPELINVLCGDMSIVGPRPLLASYLDRYTPEQARRHEVRPGMTGWAQVHGRNQVDWVERFRMDVWYVDHWSLGLDCRIIVATVGAVLTRRGIGAVGHVSMPEFLGQTNDSGSM